MGEALPEVRQGYVPNPVCRGMLLRNQTSTKDKAMKILPIAIALLCGCARYSYERPISVNRVADGKTNLVYIGQEKTDIWSVGSKTGFKGIASDTKDGDYRRKVGVESADTKGDNDMAESIARGAAQGGGAGSLVSLMQLMQTMNQQPKPAALPTNSNVIQLR